RQSVIVKSMPASFSVGTSGSDASRLSPLTASTRTWRPVTCAMISAGSCTLASILSPSTVVTASSRPKGTWVSLTPARFSSATATRCVKLPRPELPTRTAPGCTFAWARSSRTSFHGASAFTASETGSLVSAATSAPPRRGRRARRYARAIASRVENDLERIADPFFQHLERLVDAAERELMGDQRLRGQAAGREQRERATDAGAAFATFGIDRHVAPHRVADVRRHGPVIERDE